MKHFLGDLKRGFVAIGKTIFNAIWRFLKYPIVKLYKLFHKKQPTISAETPVSASYTFTDSLPSTYYAISGSYVISGSNSIYGTGSNFSWPRTNPPDITIHIPKQ